MGEEGIDLFMVDSTNAHPNGFITPEREIGPVLDQVFGGPPAEYRRILRLPTCTVSSGHQRRCPPRAVAFVGRSMGATCASRKKKRLPVGVPENLSSWTSRASASCRH